MTYIYGAPIIPSGVTDKLLTTTQVAEILGVHRSRVHALIQAGKLKAERLGDKILVIKESDLKALRIGKPGRPKRKLD